MQRLDGGQSEEEHLLSRLEGTECTYCDTGTLTRTTFRSDKAVVCEACDTPAVRFW
ncbi:HVO_A0556 family zinc finger protein [Halomontanus rarus]|uniref:HVO_A0556 family zinc finger protein n=1 Tax=Halomontanus rarus TaxID=3034020 RepID=UPI002FF6BC97